MRYDYVIIGGGITGLYLTHRLRQRGRSVALLEKSQQLGGLAAVTSRYGTPLEKAYHHFFPTDRPLLRIIDELHLSDSVQWRNVPMGMFFADQLVPFSSPTDLLRLPHLSMVDKIRLGSVMYYLQKTDRWKRFRTVKAASWLHRYSGERAYELFWKPLLQSKFDSYYQDVSLAWLWARLYVRGHAKKSVFEKEKLGYLLGSVEVLYRVLLGHLKNVVHTGVDIAGVRAAGGEWVISTNQREYQAKRIILTIPTPAAYAMLQVGSAPPINYLGAVVGTFASSQRLTEYYWISMNSEVKRPPFVVFLHHTRLVDRAYYNHRYLYYYGAYLPNDHRYIRQPKAFQRESYTFIRDVFPHFDPELILDEEVNALPFAQQIVTTDYHQSIPPLELRPGAYLCNFSQIYPYDRGMSYAIGQADELLATL